ncbi:phospholipid:lipid A palmitoyltransferase, partial [Yersinia pestis subsp. microtus bv. Caucasica]
MNYKDIINACILSGVFLLHSPSALADTPSVGVSKGQESLQPAAEGNLWQRLIRNVSLAWNSPHQELYIPVNTWHNRWTYDDEKIASYNERPWGVGYGKYRYDEDNNWHSVYAMAFMDSHNRVEPILGYGYQKMWIPGEREGWRFGAGFTASITARYEYH